MATALLELACTRVLSDSTGQSLREVVNATGYTVASWLEEFVKVSPLLLAGLYPTVRRQWGLTDFTVLGAALGGGFGLLESLLRYSSDVGRSLARPGGGWVVPDSLSPPYIPGPTQVFTSWLPAPSGTLHLDQAGTASAGTFTHLVWSALAGLAVGLLWRARKGWKVTALAPMAAAITHHTLNNYLARHPGPGNAKDWFETLNDALWAAPLLALAVAMAVDIRHIHRGKRLLPRTLLSRERADGDTLGALIRYAAWRPAVTLLIALRFARLRRTLYYAQPSGTRAGADANTNTGTGSGSGNGETNALHDTVTGFAIRIDASDNAHTWRGKTLRSLLKATRTSQGLNSRWLLLIPCLLLIPSLLFLVIGSFKPTTSLQTYFTTPPGTHIITGCALAALLWTTWQLTTLLRTWRTTTAQPLGELTAVHRLRTGTALGTATATALLLYRGFTGTGPQDKAVPTLYLLDALNNLLITAGFILLIASLLTLFPPGAALLALSSGESILAVVAAEAAIKATALAGASVALMGTGAEGGFESEGGETRADSNGQAAGSGSPETVPQGLTEEQFADAAEALRAGAGHYGDDIVVQGSRAAGTAGPGSDIDFAIRVNSQEFDKLVSQRFGSPNPGGAKERTMEWAKQTGKIQAGEAGLSGLRRALESKLGMDVDLSIIRQSGPFDNPPFIGVPR